MSEGNAETLRRALGEEQKVRIRLDGVGEVEGEPFQETLEKRAKHFEGVRPPHGHLIVDVGVNPDELPSDEPDEPTNLSIWFGEAGNGEWKEGSAMWRIQDEESADAEESADVLDIEVVSDE